jgi:hypothetical protein
VPIRPLQLCADGGYQLRLGVLGVPLIMVPDRNAELKIAETTKKSFLRESNVSFTEATKKSFLRERSVSFTEATKKSFLRERSVSFLLKSRSKGNAKPNIAEI